MVYFSETTCPTFLLIHFWDIRSVKYHTVKMLVITNDRLPLAYFKIKMFSLLGFSPAVIWQEADYHWVTWGQTSMHTLTPWTVKPTGLFHTEKQ